MSLDRGSSLLVEADCQVDSHLSGMLREVIQAGSKEVGLKAPLKLKFLRLHDHGVNRRFGGC